MQKRKGKLALLTLLCFFLTSLIMAYGAPAAAETPPAFYVAQSGDDNNSGTLEAPFRTISRARDAVRLVNGNMTSNVVVYVRGGLYELEDTLSFDQRDSGTNGYSVIYKAYPGEKAVISGGRRVTGWQQTEVNGESIWKTQISGVDDFRQLYVNGERTQRAKSSYTVRGIDFYDDPEVSLPGPSGETDKDGIIIQGNAIGSFSKPYDMELRVQADWKDFYLPVKNIVDLPDGKKAVVFDQPYYNLARWHTIQSPQWSPEFTKAFGLENAIELLDQPGEWYFDKDTRELFYWPRVGEDMDHAEIVVPVLEKMVEIRGSSPESKVENFRIEGFTFRYGTYIYPSTFGTPMIQATVLTRKINPVYWDDTETDILHMPGNIMVENANGFVFEGNTVELMGAIGIYLDNAVTNSRLTGNVFSNIANSAIAVGRITHFTIGEGEGVCSNNLINNNYITKAGADYYGAPGITAYFVEKLQILHNELHDLPYTGISVGWGWGAQASSTARENIINYNKITHILKKCWDGGGIYTLSHQENSEIKGNYISQLHNVHAALYPDEGTQYYTISDNVIEYGVPKWTHIWCDKIKNLILNNNYTTTANMVNQGVNITITNTHVIPDAAWPEEARLIKLNAGLQEAYRDIVPLQKVTGTLFGSESGFENAFDGQEETAVSFTAHSGGYMGIDLGENNEKRIVEIRYKDKSGFAGRLDGGKFQGSNISSTEGFVDLYTIPSGSNANYWNTVNLSGRTAYRYLRYLPPDNSYGNISEIEFYTLPDLISSTQPEIIPEPKDKPGTNGGNQTGSMLFRVMADKGIIMDGQNKVSRWADQSGNGNDLVQTSPEAYPQWLADSGEGVPSVSFDGNKTYLMTPSLAGKNPNTFTVSFVIKPKVLRNYNQLIGLWNAFVFHTDEKGRGYFGAGSSSDKRLDPANSPGLGDGTFEAGKWQLFTYVQDNGTASVYKNGVLLATGAVPVSENPWTEFWLGNNWGPGSAIDGEIGEFVIIDSVLTEAQRLVFENSTLKNYGIEAPVGIPADNMALWIDSGYGIISDESGKVSRWADQSGNGNDLVQTSPEAYPQWLTDSGEGVPSVSFDGNKTYLMTPSLAGKNPNTFTVSFVIKPKVLRNYNQLIGLWNAFVFHTDEKGRGYFGAGSSSDKRLDPANSPGLGDGTFEAGKWQLFTYVQDNGTASVYKNGVLLATGAVPVSENPWTEFWLGNNWGPGSAIDGEIGSFQIYTSALNTAQRDLLEKHIMQKFSITAPEEPPEEPGKLEIGTPSVKNAYGEELSVLPSNAVITITAPVSNESAGDAEITLAVALCDKHDKTISMAYTNAFIKKGSAAEVNLGYLTPKNVKHHSLKIYIWNNAQERIPLVDVMVLNGRKEAKRVKD